MPPGAEPRSRREPRADHHIGNDVSQAQSVQFVPELIIVRDVIRDCGESTDPLEIASPKSQRGAETKVRNSAQACHQSAGREISRNGESFEAAGPIVRLGPIQTSYQSYAHVGKRTRNIADIAGRHADIAVIDDQNRVT